MGQTIYKNQLLSAKSAEGSTSEIKLPSDSRADRKVKAASKGHCIAHTVLGRGTGFKVQAESNLELANLLMLNARPDVTFLKEQARFDWRDDAGKPRCHFFDAYAEFQGSQRVAITVKPQVRLKSGRFLDEIREVTRHAVNSNFCDTVRLITEADIDPAQLRNAAMYRAVQEIDEEADSKALEVACGLKGAVKLRALTIQTGLAARGYRALIRLCRDGVLAPESSMAITPETKLIFKDQ
ncbi:hypothetical protein SAMN05444000_1324 [Shimia gijangensis]|uniref:TnsA endonuclease N-terminal domain-containing protein n=1 Tax=Shimia gijangensis TaxID=1470563 RepID=A0A1M6SSZ9_9RHOB|nr:hypothetical protein [Shimia gijangensis]SHK47805.1 hypothetical protein SAMN05444000_1324 [Shimia gijangensis]